MSFIRIIPSILINEKKCVKGKKFSNYKNVGNPVSTALSFDKQKADELFIIDLNSYKKDIEPDFQILNDISKNISTPVTFGGGIRKLKDVKNAFKNGADKIFINSILYKGTNLIDQTAKIYGQQSIVGGVNLIKVGNTYKIYNQDKIIDPIDHIKKIQDKGLGEIKITFVNLEGTKKGIDLDYSLKLLDIIEIPCIFEGGISNLLEIKKLIKNGITSLALGSMLYFSDNNIIKIKKFLLNENIPVVLDY